MDLSEQVVLITGASAGIGAATAKAFAACGARLLLCARRLDKVQALASELETAFGVQTYAFRMDVCDEPAVAKAIASLEAPWSTIDILVNNAGMAAGIDKIYDMEISAIDRMIDTNIKGLLYVTRHVLPAMVARKSGHIINLGSVAGSVTYPGGAVYCATKHAVRAISEGIKIDVHGTPIRVSEIDPGQVHTDFSNVRFKGDTKRADAVYEGVNSLTADDIADTIVFCATRPAHMNISSMMVWPTDQTNPYLMNRQT
jgi:3-hydroxy acid dehydrogenase / malonic semialdehyde reductase